METTLKVFGWIGIVLGALALLGSMSESTFDGYAFLGGGLFFSWGICTLSYLKKK